MSSPSARRSAESPRYSSCIAPRPDWQIRPYAGPIRRAPRHSIYRRPHRDSAGSARQLPLGAGAGWLHQNPAPAARLQADTAPAIARNQSLPSASAEQQPTGNQRIHGDQHKADPIHACPRRKLVDQSRCRPANSPVDPTARGDARRGKLERGPQNGAAARAIRVLPVARRTSITPSPNKPK